jgi:hypothetical protein
MFNILGHGHETMQHYRPIPNIFDLKLMSVTTITVCPNVILEGDHAALGMHSF